MSKAQLAMAYQGLAKALLMSLIVLGAIADRLTYNTELLVG
jgi:hypothetical protein